MEAYKYLNLNISDYEKAVSLQNQELSLPIYPEMTEEQVVYVCDTIKSYGSR
jgi:dTDP-4-amino-4,6-dideoxygalactose transaminase